jgi:hypothetical protein
MGRVPSFFYNDISPCLSGKPQRGLSQLFVPGSVYLMTLNV